MGETRHKKRHIIGSPSRPRLAVFKSHKHFQAQIIDDFAGKTLVSASSLEKELRSEKGSANAIVAKKIGEKIAQRAKSAGVTQVVFDRGPRRYHGSLKALADAAREGGLQF